ncbi:MAG: hypothetical protein ABIJ60_03065 [Patescibacteria group bacterium]
MIKQFQGTRYKWKEQKEKYLEIVLSLSLKEKRELLEELLETDLWPYFQLITEILFDIASTNEDYIKLLEKVYLKVRNDMASSPFFEMLIKIGKEKSKIAILIYKKIQKESENEDLKNASGFILGGYSMNDEKYLNELLANKELSYPLTNITLKIILVKYENSKEIPNKVYNFLDLISKSNEEIFLRELMNLYIFLYKINKTYFYEKIKELMNKKKSRANDMIFIRIKKLGLSTDQFLELADLTKDCDEHILSELISAMVLNDNEDYYKEVEKISDLLIYWINKDLKFKIRNFNWALEELAKKNKKFIGYFLENFKKVKTEKLEYIHIFPRIFERLASQNVEEAIKQLMEKKIYDKDSKLFYELVSKIIGRIYKTEDGKKKGMLKLFLPLAKKIEEIAEKTDFINENKKSFNNLVLTENFDKVIDYIDDLLEQLRFRRTDFDFNEIGKCLSEFKELNSVTKKKVVELKNAKKYTPLFWLGSQQRDKELKKAYLGEINNFLNLSEDVPNERSNHDNKISLVNSLGNESGFWDTFSEMIFTNKFISKENNYNPIIEPKIPNKKKNADLSIELSGRKVFFEIKNSDGDRSLHLDNGAVTIKNKLDKIIKDKSSQLFDEKTFEEMEKGERKDLFFIVVDTSSSVIDEYMIADSFLGTLAIQFYRNNETGETTEPKEIRQEDAIVKGKNIISGLIYFKKQLVNLDGEIKFILVGDIIQNPYAVNKISDEDYKKLKEVIFGK